MKTLVGTLSLLLAILPQVTPAQSSLDNALWQVHVHPQRIFASPLGDIFNDLIVKKAPDGQVNVDAFVEALGFDPRTEVQEVVVFGTSFAASSPNVIANIGKSSGNLEGWLLAAPGYQSEMLASDTILHSFVPQDNRSHRIWCALPRRASDKNVILVAAFDRQEVVDLVSAVQQSDAALLSDQLTGDTVLSVSVSDLSQVPMEIDPEDPGSAIIQAIKGLKLIAATEPSHLTVSCEVTAENAARAQQLHQLVAGMKAMVQLALPKKAPEKQQLAAALENVNIQYAEGESKLSASATIDYADIESLIAKKSN